MDDVFEKIELESEIEEKKLCKRYDVEFSKYKEWNDKALCDEWNKWFVKYRISNIIFSCGCIFCFIAGIIFILTSSR